MADGFWLYSVLSIFPKLQQQLDVFIYLKLLQSVFL